MHEFGPKNAGALQSPIFFFWRTVSRETGHLTGLQKPSPQNITCIYPREAHLQLAKKPSVRFKATKKGNTGTPVSLLGLCTPNGGKTLHDMTSKARGLTTRNRHPGTISSGARTRDRSKGQLDESHHTPRKRSLPRGLLCHVQLSGIAESWMEGSLSLSCYPAGPKLGARLAQE